MRRHLIIFIKFQAASFSATLVDFAVTIILKEIFGWWYLLSTSIGSIIGGVTNFYLGRRWVFRATAFSRGTQAFRYLLGWTGSIFLNVSGVFLLTNFGHLNYLWSKIITSLLVGIFFNYILQKRFVFCANALEENNI